MRRGYWIAGFLVAAVIVGVVLFVTPTRRGGTIRLIDRLGDAINGSETIEVVNYREPPPDVEDDLADDRLEDKHPAFDPGRVDRRPEGDWESTPARR